MGASGLVPRSPLAHNGSCYAFAEDDGSHRLVDLFTVLENVT